MYGLLYREYESPHLTSRRDMGSHRKEQNSTDSRSELAEPPGRNSVDTCDILS